MNFFYFFTKNPNNNIKKNWGVWGGGGAGVSEFFFLL